MTTETHPDTSQDTTLSAASDDATATPRPKRKRTARRNKIHAARHAAGAIRSAQTGGFKVSLDSGEVVESAWHFGG